MSDQHPTPVVLPPRRHRDGPARDPTQPTARSPPSRRAPCPAPERAVSVRPSPSGAQPTPSARSGRRRTAEITAVAVLAALLSSGGTIAAVRLFPDSAHALTASSAQLGRGTDSAPVTQADGAAPDWSPPRPRSPPAS